MCKKTNKQRELVTVLTLCKAKSRTVVSLQCDVVLFGFFMSAAQLEKIYRSPACLGAFKLGGGDLLSLTDAEPSVVIAAQRTADLCSSLASLIPDLGTLIAKREKGMSIATARGGIILEASAPINIGMLRSALRDAETIALEQTATSLSASAGTKALVNLANWIQQVETTRAMHLTAGDTVVKLWARKGKFGLADGVASSNIASAIFEGAKAAKPISLSYDILATDYPSCGLDPVALFGQENPDGLDWTYDTGGAPQSFPADATVQSCGQMLALNDQLRNWGEGQAFEVTILRKDRPPVAIAKHAASNVTQINVDGIK